MPNLAVKRVFEEYQINWDMHVKNRAKLLERFANEKAIIYLPGGTQQTQYCTDREILFRQESNFQYLFGVEEADCVAVIDLQKKRSILFIPRLPESYAVWLGEIKEPSFYQSKYKVDEVHYTDEVTAVVNELDPEVVYAHKDAPEAKWFNLFKVDKVKLTRELDECRVIKSEEELDLLRYINKISSYAHIEVMKACRPGMMEYELEALFLYLTYANGKGRHMAYTCICGAGKSGATLHYPNNDKRIKDGDMMLMDMGCEFHCYSSDITCSFPANGKFTQDQREIYETVLDAQRAVMKAMKPGVAWEDMHRLSLRTIAEGLLKHGFLRGNIEDIIANHIPALFMPHGLGHFMGLDVHDVGGYPEGVEKIKEPSIENLRARRVLQKGMVITVEPGIYFIDALLEPALKDPVKSQFLNAEKIARFRNFGGVRLEDDVIVTEDGIENMTKCPRTVEEVERVMAEGRAQQQQQQQQQ